MLTGLLALVGVVVAFIAGRWTTHDLGDAPMRLAVDVLDALDDYDHQHRLTTDEPTQCAKAAHIAHALTTTKETNRD